MDILEEVPVYMFQVMQVEPFRLALGPQLGIADGDRFAFCRMELFS